MDLEGYIRTHTEAEPDYLRRIEKETNLRRINGRMCSGHLQGRILAMLSRMISPRKALELGTFTGYSALCIAEGLPEGGRLTTVEADDELEETILKNFESTPYGEKIDLIIGDALAVCKEMEDGEYDLIFIDADKREYPEYYKEAKRLLRPGGYLIADNTLWDGGVADEGKRDRQTLGIRKFNELVASDPDMRAVILPVRDGLTVINERNCPSRR